MDGQADLTSAGGADQLEERKFAARLPWDTAAQYRTVRRVTGRQRSTARVRPATAAFDRNASGLCGDP